ncbi:hypothetical protein VB776_16240 [Arcicella sp. DC2W]|uniref:Uncharacterized protein n=1 Tax=Arcicella gelida TaxID=2984195 RepID=A0ABU5S7M6_9BACT|nr:hypothetical protein [Arcicella sp. DC2W]MEA5404483.1 hypothetical protein [Arcicella sp. DC2W]
MTNRQFCLTNAQLNCISKSLKKLEREHQDKTGTTKKLVDELTPISYLRPTFVRFLNLTKSLLVYQGVLENDLIALREELETIKQKLNQ